MSNSNEVTKIYRPSEVAKILNERHGMINVRAHTVSRAYDRLRKKLGTPANNEAVRLIPEDWVQMISDEIARCAALPQVRGQRGQQLL
jgi:hypothetical protein